MNAFGLVDYVMMIAAVVASWGMYYALQPRPPDGDERPASPPLLAAGLAPLAWTAPGGEARNPALPLEGILNRICAASDYPNIDRFLAGARLAYETIITAFAEGNLAPQAHLISDSVRETFEAAITARRQRGETVDLLFIGFRTVDIIDAGMDNGRAWIDVRFVGLTVSATRDGAGRVVAGDSARVVEIAEIWGFERELRSAEPRWLLTATDTDG